MPLNAFKMLGFGTRKFQQDQEPVLRCNERLTPGCDCCRVQPCDLCLTWTTPDGDDADSLPDVDYGKAISIVDGEWNGSAGGITFYAYWAEDEYGECVITVELNGVAVWSKTLGCNEYPEADVTCRNFDGEVEYVNGYETGTFAWTRGDDLEVAKRLGDEGYAGEACARPFCGDDCFCTCPALCFTATNQTTGEVCTGIIPFTGETCADGRVTLARWGGDIDCPDNGTTVAGEFTLSRNDYTDGCEMSGTASGTITPVEFDVTLPAVAVSDCLSLSASWTETVGYDDILFSVRCARCDTCGGINSECCPDVVLSETLSVDFIQIAPGPFTMGPGDDCSCAAVTVLLYGGPLIGLGNDESMWVSGLMSWPCAGPTGNPFMWHVTVTCSANVWTLAISWYENCIQAAKPGEPISCSEYASTTMTAVASECDPFELTFQDGSPGDMFPSGICIGGITPAEMQAVVIEA